MILVDTSAWIEFLRDTGSPVCNALDALLSQDLATCDVIRMELLAGARDERHLQNLRGLLARTTVIPTSPGDFDQAAALYRQCRTRGATVRRLVDCLIAAAAIKADLPILHHDSDFTVLEQHTPVRVHSVA